MLAHASAPRRDWRTHAGSAQNAAEPAECNRVPTSNRRSADVDADDDTGRAQGIACKCACMRACVRARAQCRD